MDQRLGGCRVPQSHRDEGFGAPVPIRDLPLCRQELGIPKPTSTHLFPACPELRGSPKSPFQPLPSRGAQRRSSLPAFPGYFWSHPALVRSPLTAVGAGAPAGSSPPAPQPLPGPLPPSPRNSRALPRAVRAEETQEGAGERRAGWRNEAWRDGEARSSCSSSPSRAGRSGRISRGGERGAREPEPGTDPAGPGMERARPGGSGEGGGFLGGKRLREPWELRGGSGP